MRPSRLLPKPALGIPALGIHYWVNFGISQHRENLASLADIALEVKQVISKLSPDV